MVQTHLQYTGEGAKEQDHDIHYETGIEILNFRDIS